jgi:hypothetical protein
MANRAEKIEALKGELEEEINNYLNDTGRRNSFTLDRKGASSISSTFKSISRGMQRKTNGTNMDPEIAEGIIKKLDTLVNLLDSQAENNKRSSTGGGRRRGSKTHRRRSNKRKSRRLRRSHRA